MENCYNEDEMIAIGLAKFCLKNASLTGQIHTYDLEMFSTKPINSDFLPIYGLYFIINKLIN